MSFIDSHRTSTATGRRLQAPEYFWEDIRTGDTIESSGLTVTDAHLVSWAGLTGDIVEFHLNAEYAAGTPFGERIAHGPFTASVALGLLTQTGYVRKVVAWLGFDTLRAKKPVLIGDTIRARATLAETRPTSKPGTGVWSFEYEVLNQRDETVMTFTSGFLVARDPGDRD
ncbi:MaoC/PaaZ C-terminal domain-containing protein [Microbacterium sp. RD1]|uniref:MaoC/PaaZ C-terminal domain-containing protein n=1 Tax=Microbacterium sp. RD1 TaxID=3457313 RepID=UPI003FA53E4A